MAKFPFKRSLLQAFIAGAFLFLQTASHAGVWRLYQFWTGTNILQVGDGSAGDGTPYTWKLQFPPVNNDIYDPVPLPVSTQGISIYSTQVKIVSQLRWIRNKDGEGNDDLFDNPPAKVYLLQSYGAGASVWSADAQYATLNASDGMGDDPITMVSSEPFLPDKYIHSIGGQVIEINTYGDDTITVPSVNLNASVTLPGNRTVQPGAPDRLFASVGSDCKPVSSSLSSSVESSYKKVKVSGNPDPVQEPNVQNDDGSMIVDTVVTWIPGLLNKANGFWNSDILFTASQNAFQRPTWEWDSSGQHVRAQNGNGDTVELCFLYDASAPLNFKFYTPLGAASLNQPVTITIAAQDVYHKVYGSLPNTYMVNFHLPYENWKKWQADDGPVQQDVTLTVAAPGYANQNGGISVTYKFDDSYWADWSITAGAYLFSALGAAPNPWFAGLFSVLGIAFQNGTSVQAGGIVNFDACWNDPDSYFDPPKSGNLTKQFYRMTPRMQVGYLIHNMQGDSYDFHGYVGQVRKGIAKWDSSQKFTGEFVRSDANGGPPDYQSSPAPVTN